MSGSMPTSFQPLDNSNSPHWQFPELTDSVPADECGKVFRVVKIERQDVYNVYLRFQIPHCNFRKGTGEMVTFANLSPNVRKMPILPIVPADAELIARLEDYDARTPDFLPAIAYVVDSAHLDGQNGQS